MTRLQCHSPARNPAMVDIEPFWYFFDRPGQRKGLPDDHSIARRRPARPIEDHRRQIDPDRARQK
jgi:hypothetical protein